MPPTASAQDGYTSIPLFEFENSIPLSEEALVGDVGSLDIDAEGNIALVERSGPAVYLFAPTGELKRELAIDECSPGTPFRPIEVRFFGDGSLLVTNSGVGGFVFEQSGRCVGGLDADFRAPMHFAIHEDGRIFSYHFPSIRAADNHGATLWRKQDFGSRFPGIDGRIAGGGLVLLGNELLVSRPADPTLSRFDLNGNPVGEVSIPSAGFRRAGKDLPKAGGMNLLPDIHELVSSSSIVNSVHQLYGDTLLIQIGHVRERVELVVMSSDGRLIARGYHQHFYPPFLSATNGAGYRIIGSEMNADGEVANPSIAVYRYVGADE